MEKVSEDQIDTVLLDNLAKVILPPFEPWPKIPRLRNEVITISEKIDGTNAQVLINEDNSIFVGSRNRWITPGKHTDNYGFAEWVEQNRDEILKLGRGRHYGEWYGYGIGPRGYGLPNKRWALFNTYRPKETLPAVVENVTVLYQGPGLELSRIVAEVMADLKANGSKHIPGYMRPEGIVVFSSLTKTRYKVLCDNDDGPKAHPSPEEN